MRPITRLPQVPDYIEGLINLRGLVIPLINLRRRFGLPERETDEETRIIVVGIQEKIVGCIVDAVSQVIRVSADQIRAAPVGVTAVARRHIAALARLEDRILVILDVDSLLDMEEVDGQLPLERGAG
jgi:purine-binding chemotaxis protein CheW